MESSIGLAMHPLRLDSIPTTDSALSGLCSLALHYVEYLLESFGWPKPQSQSHILNHTIVVRY